ncbi:hypothetical protein Tco_0088971 [Tanacetum coccineum]
MNPLGAQQEQKTRKDRGTRRGRHSTSSSSAFDQPSSSHLNDDDDDDGNGEGTSCASTPSPIRYVNSLTNQEIELDELLTHEVHLENIGEAFEILKEPAYEPIAIVTHTSPSSHAMDSGNERMGGIEEANLETASQITCDAITNPTTTALQDRGMRYFMTRSSTNELFTPYKEPEQELRSSRRHFKTLSLDELRSPDFNILSDQEYSKEEEAHAMAETMEQYMSKTRTDYGSRVARPKIEEKDSFELKGQFLKEP